MICILNITDFIIKNYKKVYFNNFILFQNEFRFSQVMLIMCNIENEFIEEEEKIIEEKVIST